MSELEIASAFGAIPRTVNMNTANRVEHWKGCEFMINPEGGEFEFNNALVASRDSDVHTAFIASHVPNGSITSACLLVNDTLRFISSDISGSSALTSSHDGCSTPPTLASSVIGELSTLSACASAQFLSSASAEFTIGPNVDGALSHLVFGSTFVPRGPFTSQFTAVPTRIAH